MPQGIAVDSAGNLYIADTNNSRIRKVANGVITTVAGKAGVAAFSGDNGPAINAQLWTPLGVAVDSAGNLYISDSANHRVRKVSNGVITTIAGNGTVGVGGGNPATTGQLNGPSGLAFDPAGNLYIADPANCLVREVSNGVMSTVAGGVGCGFSGDNVQATSALLYPANGIAVDSAGNLYIEDGGTRIRRVSDGVITTVAGMNVSGFAGDNGPATSALLYLPSGVAMDSADNLYIADTYNHRVRKVSNGVITTVAGSGTSGFSGDNGSATSAQLNGPYRVAVDSAGNLYIADSGSRRVRRVSGGVITTVAGNGIQGPSMGDNGPATSAQLAVADGVAVDAAGNLYIIDDERIRRISSGVITTVAGNGIQGFGGDSGPAIGAQLNGPQGIAADPVGNLYIADTYNERIRKISSGVITTVAGNGTTGFNGDNGPATQAQLSRPVAVALDRAGDIYIADAGNYRIRKVSNGVITTVAGGSDGSDSGDNGGPATGAGIVFSPSDIAVDSAGNFYIADAVTGRVREVSDGIINTIAGGGTGPGIGDNGPATSGQLNQPEGITVDSKGDIYVADFTENRIRLPTPSAPVINQSGIVPIYSSVPVIQPGSWASIYGSNLASAEFLWNGDFPTSLGAVNVRIDNKPAYLWSVSPTQINLQVPDDTATGMVSVVVTTVSATAASTVTLAPYSPSFSLLADGRHVAAEIATPNGTGAYGGGIYDLVGPSGTFSFNTRPVKAGEILILYGVGFGPTNPPVPAGKIFSGAAPTNGPVTVTIGGIIANVAFAGITSAGLYQINVTVPNAPSGDQPLQASVNGVQTQPGPLVAVQ